MLVNKILVWSGNGTEALFMVLKAGKLESVVTVVSGFAEKKQDNEDNKNMATWQHFNFTFPTLCALDPSLCS